MKTRNKTYARLRLRITLLLAIALLLSNALSVKAVPIVRLDAPSIVNVGQQFTVSIFVDGIESPDELLRYGFNFGYQPSVLFFSGFSVATPFHDDTPSLGGPFGGSAFPGLQGDDILLGNLTFTAIASGLASLDIGDQNDAPLITGLFTALNPDRYRIISDFVSINVVTNDVPEGSPSIFLLALSFGGLALALSGKRKGVVKV